MIKCLLWNEVLLLFTKYNQDLFVRNKWPFDIIRRPYSSWATTSTFIQIVRYANCSFCRGRNVTPATRRDNKRKLTSNISKSKLAFLLFNENYSSLIASLALMLLRIKPEYFFGDTRGIGMLFCILRVLIYCKINLIWNTS